ncbi:unnamed protein product [Echinostoma caproni]|uniref:C2H2-type domain-containing protein n=1 Tax=Echinostoma caproni TaxID=27848 RepID=A0A183A6A5_9TREM|nr:unnamed protein product [Echinostoma caproni]
MSSSQTPSGRTDAKKSEGDRPFKTTENSDVSYYIPKDKWGDPVSVQHSEQQQSQPMTDKSNDKTLEDRKKACTDYMTSSGFQGYQQTCSICRRVYGSVSIGIHLRACQALSDLRSSQLAAQLAWKNKMSQRPAHPPGTICYICGRRYTNASWNLHVRRCQQKWELWNSLLPKDKQRRFPPVNPEPNEEELQRRVNKAHERGLTYYLQEDALDEIMLEESEKNRLPLDLLR